MTEPRESGRVPRYRKVFVLAPANLTTGGPEALHQLVDAIRRQGGDAYVSYYPSDIPAEIPEPYRHYDVVPAAPEDEADNLIVVPETQPLMPRNFARAKTAIWWLSVDNFFQYCPERPRWDEVRSRVNFAQSDYAADFLARHGVAPVPLTDYLNNDFLMRAARTARRDAIAYNMKSREIVARLKDALPELAALTWIEIEDRSRQDVRTLLSEVKIFADFGHHPGRDRMLREAALCGACLLTNRRGSAQFAGDVPLPSSFKLDQADPRFAQKCAASIRRIFRNFTFQSWRLRGYRRFAASGREVFMREVRDAFFKTAGTP